MTVKEKYVKPAIRVEYFSLTQSIATSCGYNSNTFYGRPTHDDPYTCGWIENEYSDEIIWMNAGVCTDSFPISTELEEGCYNAPSGTNQIFAS